jgi:hypothetical protein
MVMMILSGWIGLAVLTAIVFAALGRAGLVEEREREYLPPRTRESVTAAF